MLCFFLFASSSCLCYCWLGLAFYRYCSFVFVAAFLARIAKGETCWQRTLSFLLCKITSFEYMCTDTIFECECGAVLCAKCTIAGGQNYFVPTVDGCRDWLAGHTHTHWLVDISGGHVAQLHSCTHNTHKHTNQILYTLFSSRTIVCQNCRFPPFYWSWLCGWPGSAHFYFFFLFSWKKIQQWRAHF